MWDLYEYATPIWLCDHSNGKGYLQFGRVL